MSKKILIVGAGITGLALASLLKDKDVNVTIIDKATSINQPGYGLTVMPAGMDVLSKLGLVPAVRKLGTTARNIQVITPQKGILKTFDLADSGVDSVTVNRADLHKLLGRHFGVKNIQFSTTITSLDELGQGVDVTFSDGTTKNFDMVVGADGINSIVRSLIFPDNKAKYTGAAIWSLTLPKRYWKDGPQTVKTVWGDERFMGIFPIKAGAAVAFSMPLDPSIRPSTVDLAAAFKDLSPNVARLIREAKDGDIYSSHLRNITLDHWYKGNVVLAGDAAHAMMPSTGMGGSIGLQDADVLADLILATPQHLLHTVAKRYEKVCKPQANANQKQAFSVGKMMLAKGLKLAVRDAIMPLLPKNSLSRMVVAAKQ